MATQITLTGGAFQDPQGNVLANGTLVLRLTSDAVTTDASPEKQIVGNIPITLQLDPNGNISGTPKIWSNAELSPSGTGYTALAFSAAGGTAWKNPQVWVFNQAGGSTVDLGTMVPTSAGASYANPVITNPSSDQTVATNNLLPSSGNTSQSLGSAAAQWLANLYSLSTGAFNQVLIVDGTRFATVAAAVTAAGSNKTLVVIPQAYAGAEYNPTTINGVAQSLAPSNITILDLRGGNTGHDIDINSNAQDTANHIQTKLSVRNTNTAIASNFTTSAIAGTNQVSGVIPSGAVAGGTFETDVYGAITSNNGGIIQSVNGETAVSSTGSTLGFVSGVEGSVRLKDNGATPATTNITTAVSVAGDTITNTCTGGGTITDAFSGRFADQNAGTRNNMAINCQGDMMIADNRSIYAENASGAAIKVLTIGRDNAGTGGLNLWNLNSGAIGAVLKFMDAAATHYNWLVGSQQNLNNGFEITPSTATGGTTFSTPVITIDAASGRTNVKRIGAHQGSALVSGDFAASANWGTSPTISVVGGTDQAGSVNVTAKATTGANPTLTLTFHDGTWTTAPVVVVSRTDTAAATGAPSTTVTNMWHVTSVSATQVVFTFVGQPVANNVYGLSFICMGT